jgi:uncharacterized protein with ParB-like and HNH nuclease domain
MKTTIDCDKAYIQEIFTNWYSIPTYQRPYVWDTDQVEELLDCIKNAYEKKEDQYFIGSIVYKKSEKEVDGVTYQEFELLDGQQRITTIFLIIAAIRDIVIKNKEKFDKEEYEDTVNTCKSLIYQQKSKAKGIPERLRIVFDIRKDVRDFVDTYVKTDSSTDDENTLAINASSKTVNISIKHISNTLLVARKFFKENLDIISDFFSYLLNKVLLVYIATEDLQDAFQLFTVMNNTGLKLTNSDILKAENLKHIDSDAKQQFWAIEWEAMESYFGDDFDNFLSQIRTILVKRKADYALVKEFNDNVYSEKRWNRSTKQWEPCKALLKRGENTFEFIKDYYIQYQNIFDKNHFEETNSYEIYNYLNLMSKGLESDYWKAPVLMYFKKFKYENFLEFLKKLDNKLSIDWIIGINPTTRIDNMNAILACIEKESKADDVLKSSTFDLNKTDFTTIIDGNIYGRKYARYLLLKVDMLSNSVDSPYIYPSMITIEHILPQNPSDNSQWKKDFSDEQREEWTDKIGNLTLLSRRKNTSQGNLDYEKKVEKYFKNNIETFPSIIKLFQENKEWKLANLQKRQQDVCKLLMDNL